MGRVVIAAILCLAAIVLVGRSWRTHRQAMLAQQEAGRAARSPSAGTAVSRTTGDADTVVDASASQRTAPEVDPRTGAVIAQRRVAAHALLDADRQAAALEQFITIVDEMAVAREKLSGRLDIGLSLEEYVELVTALSDADVEAEARLSRLDGTLLQPAVERSVATFQQLENALDEARTSYVNAVQQWRAAEEIHSEQTALEEREQAPEWTELDAARLKALEGQPESLLQARDVTLSAARDATVSARRLVGELRERLRQMRTPASSARNGGS